MKMKIIKHLLLCLVITTLFFLSAETAMASGRDMFIDSCVQEIFTSENGLLTTASTSIAQTDDGFIWIGGYGGLVRYDGKTFEPYETGQLTNVSALLPDYDGLLWIASGDHGLSCYQNGTLTWLFHQDSEFAPEVKCMARSAGGVIWLGTTDGLSRIIRKNVVENLEIPELEGCYIRQILSLPDGRLLCVSRDGKLYSYDGADCEEIELETDGQKIRSVSYNRANQEICVGTSEDLVLRYDKDFLWKETIEADELTSINDLYCDADGSLFICADNGIAVYKDGVFRRQRLKIDNSVDHMICDEEGNLWFVSSRQGVLCVFRGYFDNISQSAGLSSVVVNAVQVLGDRLYVGHDNGLIILDKNTMEELEDPEFARLENVRIRSLLTDPDGNLWIATGGEGLLCYQADHSWKTYSSAEYPVIQSDKFRCLFLSGSELYAGTDEGAYRVTGDGIENILHDPEQLKSRVLSIASLGDTFYLGTDGYGLYLVRDGEVVRHLTSEDGMGSDVIMKMCPSQTRSGLWLVTGSNITCLDTEENFFPIEDIPFSNRLDILIRNQEALILTGNEVIRAAEESLFGEEQTVYSEYSFIDALSFEITANSNQYMTEDTLYICGTGGVAGMQLDNTDALKEKYQLTIDKVRIDNQITDIRDAGVCHLDPSAQRIDIGAHVLTYNKGNPLLYYYLEGFDHEKSVEYLEQMSTISYTNLDGGEYIFHFGILDPETRQVKQEITLPVEKEYQWNEILWIRTLLVLLSLALITLLIYSITRARGEREKRLLREDYERKERLHLQEIAYKDFLTGLYNRNYLDTWKSTILPEAEYPISFVIADCNNLKVINDTFGHKQGDLLLIRTAELLQNNFQEDRYTVIRLGGDEFMVLCCGTTEAEIRERMHDLREMAKHHYIENIPISFSYGVHTMDRENFEFEEGFRNADLKMLEDKRKNKKKKT